MKYSLLAFVFAGLVSLSSLGRTDQTDNRLDVLFEQLSQSPNAEESYPIEQEIWSIWVETESTELELLMQQGMFAMHSGNLNTAIDIFSEAIELDPNYAEAWNKRATVFYMQDRYADSINDIQQTLVLEPRHFGALSGLGLIYSAIGDLPAAIKAFEIVLTVNPQSPSANRLLRRLKERQMESSI